MSRTSKAWEALQSRVSQTVETVTRSSRVDIVSGGVDEIDPPEDIDEYAEQAKTNAIARANLRKFVHDVWEPGYRVEGPDETVQYFEGDLDDIEASPPEQTPPGGFLNQSTIFAGERHSGFYHFAKETTWQRWARGTATIEFLKEDHTDPESPITGFHFIRPETLYPQVQNNTNILLPPDPEDLPDDIDEGDVEMTPRGEVAAYIQFDDESILGLRLQGGFDEPEVPLSQNDVLKFVLEPDIGGDISQGEGVFGTSAIAPVSEDIAEYERMKSDRAEAVARKAYGVWTAQFKPEVLDLGERKEIIEWTDKSIENTERELIDMGPGDVLTSDANIDLEKHDSSVPDLDSTLMHYVRDITTALPAPKVTASDFDSDVNRDVTGDKVEEYDDLVREERQYHSEKWTQAFKEIAERIGLDTEGLQLKIEPPTEDNPVKSLSAEEIDRMNTYVSTLNSAAGPKAGPTALVSTEELLDVLDFPVDETSPEDVVDEMAEQGDEAAQEAWEDIMGIDALARYSEGDVVDTPSGLGVVTEIETESFEGPDGTVEASSDSPVYVVGVEDASVGVGFYKASELSEGEMPDTGLDDPTEALHATTDGDIEALNWYNPESWEDAAKPARLIALDAWQSMGASFTGARKELGSNRLAASFKDYILGGWTGWRSGGESMSQGAGTGRVESLDWSPELHPRDEEGKFTDNPISNALNAIDDFAELEDVQDREVGQFAGTTEIQFRVADESDQRNTGALALDTDNGVYQEGGIVRYGKVDIPDNLDSKIAGDDLNQIAQLADMPQNVSVDMGDFGSSAPHVRVEGPVSEDEMHDFLESFTAGVNEWFYPYDAEVAPKESEQLKDVL